MLEAYASGLAATALFLVPRTALAGALLQIADFGGAIATHLEHGLPPAAPVIIEALFWVAAFARFPALRTPPLVEGLRRTSRTSRTSEMSSALPSSSLGDRITEFTRGTAKHASPEVIETLAAELTKLAATGIAERAVAVNAKAPNLTPPDTQGKQISLVRLEPAAILQSLRELR